VTDRLYRSPGDRVIAGVAGGMAVWLNIDPSLIRIAWVLLAIFSGGIFVLVYIVMMIVVPMPPPGWMPTPRGVPPAGAGTAPGWQQGAGTWSDPSAPQGWNPPPAAPAGSAPSAIEGQPDAATGWGSGQPAPGGAPAPAWNRPTPGNAGIVGGVILIILGAWFLVDQYVDIDWQVLWPVVLIALGGVLIAAAVWRGRST
jgi:phage shock protein C